VIAAIAGKSWRKLVTKHLVRTLLMSRALTLSSVDFEVIFASDGSIQVNLSGVNPPAIWGVKKERMASYIIFFLFKSGKGRLDMHAFSCLNTARKSAIEKSVTKSFLGRSFLALALLGGIFC